MLLVERKRADRVLSGLIALHLPVALLLAQVHDSWTLALIGGGAGDSVLRSTDNVHGSRMILGN